MVEMATDIATHVAAFEVPEWLLPDTEESIVGTQWHQEAIDALANMILEVARRYGTAWDVGRGIALLETGGRYPDSRPYDPHPDAMVLAHGLPSGGIAGVRLGDVGAPLFIAEVASKSTMGNDVGAKRQLYEFIGVPEYVVFDAVGDVISPPLLAWRMEGGGYVPWSAEDDGWWHSQSLAIAFQPAQPFLSLRDRDGRRISPPREALARENQLERDLADARRRLAAMEAQGLRLVDGGESHGATGDPEP